MPARAATRLRPGRRGREATAVVLGGGGLLAKEIIPALAARGYHVESVLRSACDVTDPAAVRTVVQQLRPALLVNCAAYTEVDRAESEPDLAFAVNAEGAGNVARAVAGTDALLVHVSTDYVFDGALRRPYVEEDMPSPVGVYARSKWEGECQVTAAGGRAYIVRTGSLYGGGGRSFFSAILARARAGAPLRVVDDQVVSPTWTRALGAQIAALTGRAPPGIYHATADGQTTWYEAALEAIRVLRLTASVEPVSTEEWGSPTPRPPYSVLAHSALDRLGLYEMRPWREALSAWLLDPAASHSTRARRRCSTSTPWE